MEIENVNAVIIYDKCNSKENCLLLYRTLGKII